MRAPLAAAAADPPPDAPVTEAQLRAHVGRLLADPKARVRCTVPLGWLVAAGNVRQRTNAEEDQDLQLDVEAAGLLQNIVVRVKPIDDKVIGTRGKGSVTKVIERLASTDPLKKVELIVIAGQRRLGALVATNAAAAPVLLLTCTDDEAILFGLRENVRRVNLRPWEIADAAIKLHGKNRFTWPYQKIAEEIRISPQHLSRLVTCAEDLCPRLQAVFRGDQAGYGGATLADLMNIAGKFKDPLDQERAWDELMEQKEFAPRLHVPGRGPGIGKRMRKKSARMLRAAAASLSKSPLPGARVAAATLAWASAAGAPMESLYEAIRKIGDGT